jgi:PhzF family phenazine biosynthesis protein
MKRPFVQVDVFTDSAYFGNPVAVVLDASELGDDEMQRFAHWTNLSETTFVLPPTDPAADYRVRIFTPVGELSFAGHPTLGTCHAWLAASGEIVHKEVIVQECAAGLVTIRRCNGILAFASPPLLRYGAVDETLICHIADVLRVHRGEITDAHWLDNGPGWVGVLLRDAQAVLDLRPGIIDLDVGVAGPYPAGSEAAFEVRAFFPKDGATVEDPVTGSLNASFARWFFESGRAKSHYVATQGAMLGRRGRVHVELGEGGTIWVGGGTTTCVEGTVEL